MKEKIGFFGGCFNPPSNVHINLAKELIKNNKVDKIIFVPVGDFYQKENLIPAIHRYNMLKLATNKYDYFEVSNIELNIDKKLYAIDIFKLIKEKYNKKDIYFIMGSDNFDNMCNWKDYEKIKNKYKYIVMERNDNYINSTQIRNMFANASEKAKEVLPEEVFKYIKENNLYV